MIRENSTFNNHSFHDVYFFLSNGGQVRKNFTWKKSLSTYVHMRNGQYLVKVKQTDSANDRFPETPETPVWWLIRAVSRCIDSEDDGVTHTSEESQ